MSDDLAKDFLLDAMKNKKKALNNIIDGIDQLDKIEAGLKVLHIALKDKGDKVDFQKTALALTKTFQNIVELMQHNTLCTLLYLSEGDFDRDAASLLNKMGYGEEALKQMAKNKFGDLV